MTNSPPKANPEALGLISKQLYVYISPIHRSYKDPYFFKWPMAYINQIETALPQYKYHQADLGKFMHTRHIGIAPQKIDTIFSRSSITTRYSVLPDFGKSEETSLLFGADRNPCIQDRLTIYKKEAPLLGKAACENIIKGKAADITHLITVTCTGLSAPGLDYELIKSLGLDTRIQRFSVNFMGCFAAFHALKLADTICKAASNAVVLIVCVELCTLHLHRGDDLESVVANTLFADGAAACLVSNHEIGLSMEEFLQDIVPSSSSEMAWDITSGHFLMKLSSYVPDLIGDNIQKFCQRIKGLPIKQHAVHPGGRKILESYQKTLGIQREDMAHSYDVLDNYGNMSSPTILFVLKKALESSNKGRIFAAGFGPGLSMEGILLLKQ